MFLRWIAVLSMVPIFAFVACSPGPAPVSQSLRDPSNPSAAEGVLPLPSIASSALGRSADGASSSHTEHDEHGRLTGPSRHGENQHSGNAGSLAQPGSGDAGTPAAVYVCPMHPEVTSSAPGRCPKCGMNLVPKK
jgi:hypothetical protein